MIPALIIAVLIILYVCAVRLAAVRNRVHNMRCRAEEGIVYCQCRGSVSALRYGLFPAAYNGCEVIAVHNALRLLSRPSDLRDMFGLFQKEGLMVLLGLFGSSAIRMPRVFRALGLDYERVRTVPRAEGVYILCFWNPGPPFHGIHTVAAQYRSGEFRVFNLFTDESIYRGEPERFFNRRLIRAYRVSL